MLGLVLAAALIAQVAHGAPTNCGELCEQSTGSYGQSWGSHSSYSKQSRYGSQGSYSSGSRGLGATGSRLEDFDENALIGTAGHEQPRNWHDEKHYVTDDGKGEMNFRAGQTVTNNGYSKYASHSYRYGSHDSHVPLSNSQVLSTSEFNSELQNIRSRIASFMGSFNLGSSSLVNSNFLEDFKHKANLISTQLNDVCGQVDVGSSMYQQMQQEIQQFQRQVEERQRQIEATVFHSSSTSGSSSTHGSQTHYPVISSRPAPIVQPDDNTIIIQRQQQQRIEEEIVKVHTLISSFYSTFNRVDSDVKFQEDLNTQVNVIIQKLLDLNSQAQINQSQRQRIEKMKSQYETFVSMIRTRIQDQVRRNQEEEVKRQQRLQEIENERIRLENDEKAKLLQLRLEEDRLRQQEIEAERQRLATERKRQDEEAENRRRLQALEEEKIRIRNEELNAEQTRRQNENLQLQLDQQQQQLQQLHTVQTTKPEMTGSIQMTGTTSTHHTVTGTYGNTGSSETTGSYTRPVVLAPHVDLTAAVNRLQQELNRVQNEVNKFNTYRMRLTADNKLSIVNEAKHKYEQLRQNLDNLCQTSTSYNNQNILNNAQELQRHFERLYQNFKHEADGIKTNSNSQSSISGGFSSSNAYESSETYKTIQQPKISNVEFTHEKSTEIEIGSSRRPAQHYSSGSGYSQSSGYSSYGSNAADNNFRSSVLDLGGGVYSSNTDCVEQQAGQPCITPPRRYRRNIGDYGPIFDQPDYIQQSEDYYQKYVVPSLDYYQTTRRIELSRDHEPINQYNRQQVEAINNYEHSRTQDFIHESSRFGDEVLPAASENLELSQQVENLTQQQNSFAASGVGNERFENLDDSGIGDLTQQSVSQVNFGPGSQVGRGFSSQHTSKPERYSYYSRNNSQQSQSLQENVSQRRQQSSDNLQELGSANIETERSYTNTENQEYISTIRPTVRPAPKPVPRYSRPWRVNNINSENQNANTEQSSTPKSVKPLRGDLPGQSESTTSESNRSLFNENIPVTNERPSITPTSYNDFGLEQQYERVDLDINNESRGLQNSRNDEVQNHSDRAYGNFSYSQNSNYFNQQSIDLYQTVGNTLNQLETQLQSNGYGNQSYNYNLKPRNFESTSQNIFDQQSQFSSFEQSSQYEFSQRQETSQRSEDFSAAGRIPLDEKKSIETLQENITNTMNTTPTTFWKKIGQKLSHTYDKAKEKAKNIFG